MQQVIQNIINIFLYFKGEPIEFEECRTNHIPCPPPPIFVREGMAEKNDDENKIREEEIEESKPFTNNKKGIFDIFG